MVIDPDPCGHQPWSSAIDPVVIDPNPVVIDPDPCGYQSWSLAIDPNSLVIDPDQCFVTDIDSRG